jgi:hypothetical protein
MTWFSQRPVPIPNASLTTNPPSHDFAIDLLLLGSEGGKQIGRFYRTIPKIVFRFESARSMEGPRVSDRAVR